MENISKSLWRLSFCICFTLIFHTAWSTPETLPPPKKKALIFGVTGQDGAYLAEFLINKDYEVHGVKRPASQPNTSRIDQFYEDPQQSQRKLILHYGDVGSGSNIIQLMQTIRPDEVYNLAAQSHVQVSFSMPEFTAEIDALGTLRILEAIRLAGLERQTKFYQASTSELYGLVQEIPQTEKNALPSPLSLWGC